MTGTSASIKTSVGLHVHLYLWIAVVAVAFAILVVVVDLTFDGRNPLPVLGYILGAEVLWGLAIWRAARCCSTPDLRYWDGLLLVTAYMAVGIGGFSMLIAIPSALIALLGSVGVSLSATFRSDTSFAPTRFRRMVGFFYRHRIYQ